MPGMPAGASRTQPAMTEMTDIEPKMVAPALAAKVNERDF